VCAVNFIVPRKSCKTKLVQHGHRGVRPFAVRSWKQLRWRGKNVAGSVSARCICNYSVHTTFCVSGRNMLGRK